MKWPEELTLIRHDRSAFNELKDLKEADPQYLEFKRAYETDYTSPRARELAQEVYHKYNLDCGDHDTPLVEDDGKRAETMARRLKESGWISLPDKIYVSPYLRTMQTYDRMTTGWPELKEVKMVSEGRIREQEHGLSGLYNDWRIFHVFYPDQKLLYEKDKRFWYRYPQGENGEDVRDRNRSWMTTLVREDAGEKVMAVTHHLTTLLLRMNLERLSVAKFIDLDEHDKPINCGVTIYRGHPDLGKEGRLILERYNQLLY